MKTCGACKEQKPRSEFRKRSAAKDGLQSVCTPCDKDRQKRYYRDNPSYRQSVIERHRRNRERNREIVDEIKSGPCTDCKGTFDPIAMDFDHIGDDKTKAIAEMVIGGFGIETIKAEIAKCELVCSNCHRVRTRDRLRAPGENRTPKNQGCNLVH